MSKEITRTKFLRPKRSLFCPGCMHSTTSKLLGESLEELGIMQKSVCCMGIGCCALGMGHWNVDILGCAHGRAAAVATGMKLSDPNSIVFTYQGDGDAAAIGIAETLYSAVRGINITVIFENNGTYAMTGGQLAPTTALGQWSSTSINGRNPEIDGYPIDMCAVMNTLQAPTYIARVAVNNAPNIIKAKAAIKKGLQNQVEGKGFSFIELVNNCPTNWHMSPLDTLKYIEEKRIPEYPLGVFRDKEAK